MSSLGPVRIALRVIHINNGGTSGHGWARTPIWSSTGRSPSAPPMTPHVWKFGAILGLALSTCLHTSTPQSKLMDYLLSQKPAPKRTTPSTPPTALTSRSSASSSPGVIAQQASTRIRHRFYKISSPTRCYGLPQLVGPANVK